MLITFINLFHIIIVSTCCVKRNKNFEAFRKHLGRKKNLSDFSGEVYVGKKNKKDFGAASR